MEAKDASRTAIVNSDGWDFEVLFGGGGGSVCVCVCWVTGEWVCHGPVPSVSQRKSGVLAMLSYTNYVAE